MFGKTGSKYVSMGVASISSGSGDRMYTRKGFLTGGISLATMGGALGATRCANSIKAALTTPNVVFKDLQTVKMLSGGGRVYALSSRVDSISLSTVFVSPEG